MPQNLRFLAKSQRARETQRNFGSVCNFLLLTCCYQESSPRHSEKRPSFEAILALADALDTSPAAFFQFEKEESSEKTLRKRIDGLISRASTDELQKVYRVLRALLEP